jgi:hypothetical protein
VHNLYLVINVQYCNICISTAEGDNKRWEAKCEGRAIKKKVRRENYFVQVHVGSRVTRGRGKWGEGK